jgi:hypothetical protein
MLDGDEKRKVRERNVVFGLHSPIFMGLEA